jgi:hypothetical protein
MMSSFLKNAYMTIFISAIALSAGCAGSASHKVVTANTANDTTMACVDIEREIAQTQSIIDEVNKDKDDISGADVIDGVLWFPFNLIAKSQNYNDALQAADKRIARLNEMKKEKDCANDANAVAQTQNLTNQLSELNRQYKDGSLTEEEYKLAKAKLLRD